MFKRKKKVLEWNEFQQIIASRDNLKFIKETFWHNVRVLGEKPRKRARTPDQILKGQIRPIF